MPGLPSFVCKSRSVARASLSDKAEDILQRHSKGAPMHYRRITELGIEEGLITPGGATPEASLNSAVTQDIKKRELVGDSQRFRAHGRGLLLAGSAL